DPHPPSPVLPAPHRQPEPRPVPSPALAPPLPAFSPAGFLPYAAPPDTGPVPLPTERDAGPAGRRVPAPPLPGAASRRLAPVPPRLTCWWQRSLVWANRTFDRWTCRLGRPGRWLQGTTGRTVLGWLGIGLLCVAAGWGLSNWFDWTW